MGKVEIVRKKFTNETGDVIPWQVIAISGSINGEIQTLEIKVNKTEAMLAGMLLASTEKLHVEYVSNDGAEVEVKKKSAKKGDFLDDLLED